MKTDYLQILAQQRNNTNDVKSAEGDNIKYPKVKKAEKVEDISASM